MVVAGLEWRNEEWKPTAHTALMTAGLARQLDGPGGLSESLETERREGAGGNSV